MFAGQDLSTGVAAAHLTACILTLTLKACHPGCDLIQHLTAEDKQLRTPLLDSSRCGASVSAEGCTLHLWLAEWHAWDERVGSENDPVDNFPADQLYVVYAIADGGTDLEKFELRSFTEARSILLQVAASTDLLFL